MNDKELMGVITSVIERYCARSGAEPVEVIASITRQLSEIEKALLLVAGMAAGRKNTRTE